MWLLIHPFDGGFRAFSNIFEHFLACACIWRRILCPCRKWPAIDKMSSCSWLFCAGGNTNWMTLKVCFLLDEYFMYILYLMRGEERLVWSLFLLARSSNRSSKIYTNDMMETKTNTNSIVKMKHERGAERRRNQNYCRYRVSPVITSLKFYMATFRECLCLCAAGDSKSMASLSLTLSQHPAK